MTSHLGEKGLLSYKKARNKPLTHLDFVHSLTNTLAIVLNEGTIIDLTLKVHGQDRIKTRSLV